MSARDVFVSYSQADRECAFQLVAQLESRGIGVWVAPRDISPGTDWAEAIIEAISGARLMVLVFSASCNASPQVRREVERAVHREIPILPFRIEDVLPAKSLEYFLSTPHWLDAFPLPREPHLERLGVYIEGILNAPTGTMPTVRMNPGAAAAPAASAIVSPVARNQLLSLDVTEMESLERRLAYYVGPVAKLLVKRAASKATSREDLARMLADEVDAAPARKQFLDACRHDRH
jgi:hypothetical protein